MADLRLLQLFDLYLAKRCTPAEVEELINLLQHEESENSLDPAMYRVWERIKEEKKIYPVNWQEMYEKVTSHEAHPGKRVRPRLQTIMSMAAAVTAFLILSAGAYLWYHSTRGRKSPTEIVHVLHDVLPGGNKAVLTLGNGMKITLNDVAGGALAKQGGMQVIKLDSGQLAYRRFKGTSLSGDVPYNTLTTPRGGQYQVVLPDGTKVWLNAASSIRYPTSFEGEEREVAVSGEAYFEVADNPKQPFIVNANNTRIQVLGTHFNVKAYSDEVSVKTTLLEGKVRIRSLTNEGKAVTMAPGQQVQISKDGKMKLIQNADVDEAVAWKNNLFMFHHDDLTFIMQQLSRWYDIQVEYAGGRVPASHFTGAIRRNANLSEVLKMLELTGGAHFDIEGKIIIVAP